MAGLADNVGLRGSFIFCILVNLLMVGLSLLIIREVKGYAISSTEGESGKDRE